MTHRLASSKILRAASFEAASVTIIATRVALMTGHPGRGMMMVEVYFVSPTVHSQSISVYLESDMLQFVYFRAMRTDDCVIKMIFFYNK